MALACMAAKVITTARWPLAAFPLQKNLLRLRTGYWRKITACMSLCWTMLYLRDTLYFSYKLIGTNNENKNRVAGTRAYSQRVWG